MTMASSALAAAWCAVLAAVVTCASGASTGSGVTIVPLAGEFERSSMQTGPGVQSPCPAVFRYEWDSATAEWHGALTAPSLPYGTPARLVARLSIGRVLPSKYAGSLELVGPRAEVLHAMLNEQPIRYRVNFPLPFPLPLVTAITLNDRLICSGPVVSGPIVTSITLEHTLYPHGQNLNSGSRPPVQQRFPSRDSDVLIPPQTQQPPQQPVRPPTQVEPLDQPATFPEVFPVQSTTTSGSIDRDTPIMNAIERGVLADVCGTPVAVRQLIANGETSRRGAHPWLAALFSQKPLGLEFSCGANLISARHVITAAHCIRYGENRALAAEEIVIILGKYRIHKWTESGAIVREASRVVLHPEYRALSGDADLAAIILSEPVRFSDTVRPLCVWPPTASQDLSTLVGHIGSVVGWGRDETGAKVTPEPRETRVKVVSQEECLRSRLEFRYITSNRTLCAGGVQKGSGPCTGDSGGGLLVQRDDGRWYLRGIISMSLADPNTKSCDLEHYSVFVDMAKFVHWIGQFLQ